MRRLTVCQGEEEAKRWLHSTSTDGRQPWWELSARLLLSREHERGELMAAFRLRQRRTRRWWYAGATLMALAFFGVFFVVGAAAVTGSPSNFESSDGNMTLQTNGNTDWNCFQGKDGFATLTSGTPAGCKVTSGDAAQVSADLPSPPGEITWTKGQKFDTACPTIDTKSTPPKDDFTNVAEYAERDSSNNLFFYGGSIRSTANGNTSGDVEFNQTAGSGSSFGCRTAGDLLIAYDFLNGGTSLDFHVLTWITTASPNLNGNTGTCLVKTDSLPCWGAVVVTPDASTFDGQANQAAITAANNGISGTALVAQQFAEFGINLTRALSSVGGTVPCFPQQVWESRSSGSSFTSSPEDLEFVHLSTCGSVTIIKHTDPRGLNQAFSYTSNLNSSSGCSQTLTSGGFSLNDSGNSTTDNAANTNSCTTVGAGTTTVNEPTEPSGFTFESLTCVDSGGNSTSTSGTTATIMVAANGSTTCTYVNKQNTASLKTQVSSTSVFPGSGVTDLATVTGSNTSENPSGDVTFYLCSGTTTGCSSTSNSVGTGTLSGSGGVSTATSPAVNTSSSPLAAGNYCFGASWPGDTNYPGKLTDTVATNECFTVKQIGTTTVTTPSPTLGTTFYGDKTVTDSALITAAQDGGGAITGSVDFSLCSPSQMAAASETSCVTGGTDVGSTTTLTDQGSTPPSAVALSAAFTNGGNGVNQTGTWCWRAVYTPDTSNYTGSSDSGPGECFTVTDTTSANSAQTWLPNDTGNVSSVNGAPLNGTLSIQLYTGDNCGATSGSAVSGALYTKGLTGTSSSASLTTSNTTHSFLTSQSVSWLVKFTSTDSNVTGSSECEVSSLTITN
jgi:hypothetical protein